MNRYTALAHSLVESEGRDVCERLSIAPVETLKSLGIKVVPFAGEMGDSEECSCDGVYFSYPGPMIGYRPTRSRREVFTLLHEFGHHAARRNDDVLSALADIGDDGGIEAEERVCDAFAGLVLVTDEMLDNVLGSERPLAQHLRTLYDETNASLEACAVRLAERVSGFGYVVIGDPSMHTVRFASPSPSTQYRWRRGSQLAPTHALWRCVDTGAYRGEAQVIWPTGARRQAWMDAETHGASVIAVFSEHRHWQENTLSTLSGGSRLARSGSYRGTCRSCGRTKWGYRLHDPCEETWCQHCGKCGCDAPSLVEPETRTCATCGLTQRAHLFVEGDQRCRDCRE